MNLQTLFKLVKIEKGRESEEAAKIRRLAAAADEITSSNHIRRL